MPVEEEKRAEERCGGGGRDEDLALGLGIEQG
jgi:hypothetical protein